MLIRKGVLSPVLILVLMIHSRTCSVSATGHNETKIELQKGLKPCKFHSLCLEFPLFIFITVQEICIFVKALSSLRYIPTSSLFFGGIKRSISCQKANNKNIQGERNVFFDLKLCSIPRNSKKLKKIIQA